MNLKECRLNYYEYSSKASELLRKLYFAGFAIVWIFKTNTETGPKIPIELAVSSIFFVLTLASDLFQYFSASILWSIYGRIKELKGTKDEDEFEVPRWINWPANCFFYFKFIFAFIAYGSLLKYLYNLLFLR